MSIINQTTSEVSICSNALLLLAHPTINSFDDAGAGATISKNLFPNVYKTFLSSSNWNFATKYVQLSKLVEEPKNKDFKFQYALPNDVMRINTTYPINDYEINGTRILSNEPELHIEYQALVPVTDLPPTAVDALQKLMASTMAYPLTNDGKKTELYASLYVEALKLAKYVDSQNDVNQGFVDNTLVNVRGY